MISLIFRPEGEEPEREDFRTVRATTEPSKLLIVFDNMDQVIRYLTTRDWNGLQPWVRDHDRIMGPDEVIGLLPD